VDWRLVEKDGGSRLRSRTQMASREMMHGESTQALYGTHWIGLCGARHRASGVLDVCEREGGTNKEDSQLGRRSDKVGQTVIARWSGIERAACTGVKVRC